MTKAIVASVLLAAGLASSAHAALGVLYQTGFEAPQFAPGSILAGDPADPGQDGWVGFPDASGGLTPNAQVVNTPNNGGSQSLNFKGNSTTNGSGGNAWIWQPINYTPSAGEIVRAAVDIRRDQNSQAGGGLLVNNSFWAGIDVFNDTTGSRIGSVAMLRGGADRANASATWTLAVQGLAGTTAGLFNLGIAMPLGQWHGIGLRMNFATQTFTVEFNGSELVDSVTLLPLTLGFLSSSTGIADADLTVQNRGRDDYFFDNYVVEVIPAPGTAALLGLGGLMAARRRRN